jgi:methylmalonyl-CoA/ethylmalonyl-CoA epimerase
MNLQNYGLVFHHFGLAVSNVSRALHFLKGLGYRTGEYMHDPLQNVHLVWCEHPNMPPVELVSPSDSPGPLDHYLSDMNELIYHLCFQSEDVAASVSAIRNDNIRVLPVTPPKPAKLFGGKEVSFYMIKGFGLVEFLQN